MSLPARVLVAVSLLALIAPGAATASFDLTHGQRFGNAPNEIVDVSSDGMFVVATQGKGVVKYDVSNLGAPVQSAIYADLDNAPSVEGRPRPGRPRRPGQVPRQEGRQGRQVQEVEAAQGGAGRLIAAPRLRVVPAP